MSTSGACGTEKCPEKSVDRARRAGKLLLREENCRSIAFYLYPNFSMLAFASAIEALRLANRVARSEIYSWTLITTGGESAQASNGAIVQVDQSAVESRIRPGKDSAFDYAFVISGVGVERYRDRSAESWLRVQRMQGCRIGALCTGAYVLAQAGMLRDRRCVIHWGKLTLLRERFPDVQASAELYEVDDRFLTCGGGTASLDLMLYLIREEHGVDLAWKVTEECLLDRVRDPHDRQRLPLQARLGIQNNKVINAIEVMEANLQEPLDLEDLAGLIGLSRRQMERLFLVHIGQSPARYYLGMRLDRARHLLYQSDMNILDIAMRCGFISASHFSKCYKRMYGKTPRQERKIAENV